MGRIFQIEKINYVFFSAAKANELLEKEREELENLQNNTGTSSNAAAVVVEQEETETNESIRILKIEELENCLWIQLLNLKLILNSQIENYKLG